MSASPGGTSRDEQIAASVDPVVVLADALNQFAMRVELTAREHGLANLFDAARRLREDIAELIPE